MTDPSRAERDFLGTVRVPADALWGAATSRALQNSGIGFPVLGSDPSLLPALLRVKQATARANGELGIVDPRIAEAIDAAAGDLVSRPHPEAFPLEVVQGGGGTALHMNVNEVLAALATSRLRADGDTGTVVHANDHVNRSQSTNDVFPTAANIAVLDVVERVLAGLSRVAAALDGAAGRARGDRLGRSCLMDAVPLPISAGLGAQALAVRRAGATLETATRGLREVPLGGTAVGTGLGAPDGFADLAVARLAALTGRDLLPARNRFDAIASLEGIAVVMDAIAGAGRVLGRIAGDLRLLAAGPVGGAGEVLLPPVQAGSSIMPGKVNPVIPELVMQTWFRLAGAAHTVQLAAASPELDVTPMGPIAVAETLASARALATVSELFAARCLDGLDWDLARVAANLAGSYHSEVVFAVEHGYDAAATRRRVATAGEAG